MRLRSGCSFLSTSITQSGSIQDSAWRSFIGDAMVGLFNSITANTCLRNAPESTSFGHNFTTLVTLHFPFMKAQNRPFSSLRLERSLLTPTDVPFYRDCTNMDHAGTWHWLIDPTRSGDLCTYDAGIVNRACRGSDTVFHLHYDYIRQLLQNYRGLPIPIGYRDRSHFYSC